MAGATTCASCRAGMYTGSSGTCELCVLYVGFIRIYLFYNRPLNVLTKPLFIHIQISALETLEYFTYIQATLAEFDIFQRVKIEDNSFGYVYFVSRNPLPSSLIQLHAVGRKFCLYRSIV